MRVPPSREVADHEGDREALSSMRMLVWVMIGTALVWLAVAVAVVLFA